MKIDEKMVIRVKWLTDRMNLTSREAKEQNHTIQLFYFDIHNTV